VAAGSLPAIAYLMIDSGTVEKRWLFLDPGYPARYAVFLVVELVLWFWIFYITPRQENEPFKRSDIVVAGVSLLLLPLYSIGFSNDFTMRASIPALALIALAAAPRIGSMLQVPGARRIVLATGLAIAAATPGVEIARAIAMPTIALGSCSLPHAWKDWMQEIGRRVPMTSYIARSDTRPAKLLLAPPAQAISADQPCGPHIYAFPFTLPEARNAKLETVHGQTP